MFVNNREIRALFASFGAERAKFLCSYIETPDDVAGRVRHCLKYAPAEALSFALDCGLSQTARWAARQKLANLVSGVSIVRRELGLT